MITIGTDPEVFLQDTRTGSVVPAVGLIGGTKDKPREIAEMGKGFAVQEDNVMLEYNIPPATDPEQFQMAVRGMLAWCDDFVRTKDKRLGIDYGCERLFPMSILHTPQAMEFGCAPDFNAYEQGEPWPVVDPHTLNENDGAWRFAGGHVHVGFADGDNCPAPPFVQAAFADLFLGLPSVGADRQEKRRSLYGQAGRFRPTKYGFEYRVLSNFWIFSDESAYDVGMRAIRLGQYLSGVGEDEMRHAFQEVPWKDVQTAIQTGNEVAAADILAYAAHDLRIPGVA